MIIIFCTIYFVSGRLNHFFMFSFYITKNFFVKGTAGILIIMLGFLSVFFMSCAPAKTDMETSTNVKELRVISLKELEKLNTAVEVFPVESVVSSLDSSIFEGDTRNYFLNPFRLHSSRINVIEDVASSSRIYTGGQDGKIFEIIVNENSDGTRSFTSRILAEGSRPVLALAASPDGKYLAVSQFSLVSIINLKSRNIEAQFHRVKGRILSMVWDINSSILLLGRANGDIFTWNIGSDVTRASNSTDVLEFYETNPSPVVKMVFHPSGRAFFAALQGGSIYLIRLVRTERELGLRLDTRKPGMKEGKYVVRIGRTPSLVNDMLLDASTEQLMVSAADGAVYRWKLRGLRKVLPYPTGSDSSGFISLIHTGASEDTSESDVILSTLGRNLRIRFWCTDEEVYEVIQPTTAVLKNGEDSLQTRLELKSSEDDILDKLKSELLGEISGRMGETKAEERPLNGLIAESPRFLETVIAGRYSSASGILWIGEKTGALIGFDVRGYLSSNQAKSRISNVCKRE